MNSILSLDSYNRGYDAGIFFKENTLGAKIGDYVIHDISSQEEFGSIGFFASHYKNLNPTGQSSDNIISFRGTDEIFNLVDDEGNFIGQSDAIYGWPIAIGGNSFSFVKDQADAALSYYSKATSSFISNQSIPSNFSLTGHSLGGGLAGFVSSLSGVNAEIFDNMPFVNATFIEFLKISGNSSNFDFRAPSFSQIKGNYVNNEFLEFVRSGISILNNENSLVNQSEIDNLNVSSNIINLHSIALMTSLIYGEDVWSPDNGIDWSYAAKFVLSQISNEEIGMALGRSEGNDPLIHTGNASPGAQLSSIIAYSAVEGDVKPFGDIGIAALFDDMNDLGNFLNPNENQWTWLVDNAENIGKLIVNFAGRMSVGKVSEDKDEFTNSFLLDGIISSGVFNSSLNIDNSDELWNYGIFGEDPENTSDNSILLSNQNKLKVGLEDIHKNALSQGEVNSYLFRESFVEFLKNYNDEFVDLNTDDLDNYQKGIFDNYTFVKGVNLYGLNFSVLSERIGLSSVQITESSLSVQGSMGDEVFIGFNDANSSVIRGGGGTDFIIGGMGNDMLSASFGSWILGGVGNDIVSLGESPIGFGAEHPLSLKSSFSDGGDDFDILYHSNFDSLVINTGIYDSSSGLFSDGKAIVDGVENRFANFEEYRVMGDGDVIFNGNGQSIFKGSTGSDTFNILIGDSADGDGSILDGINHVSFRNVIGGINMRPGGVVLSNSNDFNFSLIKNIDIISGTSNNDIFSSELIDMSSNGSVMFNGGSGNDLFDMFDRTVASGGSGSDTFVINMNKTSSFVYPQIFRITDFKNEDLLAIKFNNETHYLSGNELSSVFYSTIAGNDGSFTLYEKTSGTSEFSSDSIYITDRTVGYFNNVSGIFNNLETSEIYPGSSWLSSFDFMEYDPVSKTGVINLKVNEFGPVKIIFDDIDFNDFGLSYNSIDSDENGKRYNNQILNPNDPLNSFSAVTSFFHEEGYKYIVDSSYIQNLKDLVKIPEPFHEIGSIDSGANLPGHDDLIIGTSGDDFIQGDIKAYESVDIIEGGTGNDLMFGAAGSDIYVINAGDGHDEINDLVGDNDYVIFKGLSYSEANFERSNYTDLIIRFSNEQSVKINNFFSKSSYWSNSLESVIFENEGGALKEDIEYIIMSSMNTDNDDIIEGFESGSIFNTSLGDDSFYGLSGNDHYEYHLGHGYDKISDVSGYDTLYIDTLSTNASFSFSNDMSDIIISINGIESIRIKNGINKSVIDEIHFEDEVVLNYGEIISSMFVKSLDSYQENQILYGSIDGDSFSINHGNSTVYGFSGNDIFNISGSGSNSVFSGDGNDTVIIGGIGNDTQNIDLGEGNDTIRIFANFKPIIAFLGEGNDFVQSSSGDDIIYGGNGDDYIITGGGFDSLYGGNGRDEVEFIFSPGSYSSGVIVDMTSETVTYFGGVVKDFIGFEAVRGSSFDDSLTGSSRNDSLTGWLGNDYIYGRDGNDWLSGEEGNDVLYGGNQNDYLNGGLGDDLIDGGSGYDTAFYYNKMKYEFNISTLDGVVSIIDNSINENHGVDNLVGIENLYFMDGFVSIASPVILDLNGDGVNLIEKSNSTSKFDFDDDGIADSTGWFSSGDGMLVFDENQNAQVDGLNEVSFTNVEGALSDLDGLRKRFDTNDDGVFSDLDLDFGKFGVWQDLNGDGVQDNGEYSTLAQLGISSISLIASAVNQDWQMGENIVVGEGSFVRNGELFAFKDVGFIYDSSLALSMEYEEEIDRGSMLRDSFWSLPEHVTI
jgi:Ca2+-binding RTX toxin-like protein